MFTPLKSILSNGTFIIMDRMLSKSDSKRIYFALYTFNALCAHRNRLKLNGGIVAAMPLIFKILIKLCDVDDVDHD